jgi:hypothetical protein
LGPLIFSERSFQQQLCKFVSHSELIPTTETMSDLNRP